MTFMIGGFADFTNNQGGDWGENLLNTVASNTIRHLFTQSESVDVAVRCNPSSKLLQGSIDSFKMSGRGLVIRKDFRTEEMSFEACGVSLDFSSILKGKMALKQPAQAIALVKLTEKDLNNAFKAELVSKRLKNVSSSDLSQLSGGEAVSFTDVKLELLPRNRVRMSAQAHLPNTTIPVSLSSTLAVAKRRQIRFKEVQFEAAGIPEETQSIARLLSESLGKILNEMVDLDRFNLDGVTLRINRLETQGKNLLFSGYAQIERIPQIA